MTFPEVYLDQEAWSRTFVKSCLLLNVYLEVVRESHRHTAQTLKQLVEPETSAVFKALRDKSRRPHEIHSTVSVNSAQMAGTSGRDQDHGITVSRNAKGYILMDSTTTMDDARIERRRIDSRKGPTNNMFIFANTFFVRVSYTARDS